MRSQIRRCLAVVAGFAGVLALGNPLSSQDIDSTRSHTPASFDWSHRHLIFSAPATLENAVRIQSDVRYWHQRARRNAGVMSQAAPLAAASQALERFDRDGSENDSSLSGSSLRDPGIRADVITSIMSRRERRWFRRGKLLTRDW